MEWKWATLCKCISFSHGKKQASFWRQEHSFPPPTSLIYYSYSNVSIQLFHLVSFFSYVANWNHSLVKLCSLAPLCQNFTIGGNLFMWLQTFLSSTHCCFPRQQWNTLYRGKIKHSSFFTPGGGGGGGRKMHLIFCPCLHLCSSEKWGNKHPIWGSKGQHSKEIDSIVPWESE